MKTVASLRVSTGSQDLATQKLAILDFTQKRRFTVDAFIESRISSRKSPIERRIEEMLGTLQSGDRLLVSELSRLGRSLSQVLQIVATLIERKIRFIPDIINRGLCERHFVFSMCCADVDGFHGYGVCV